jgi:hypothetical protein
MLQSYYNKYSKVPTRREFVAEYKDTNLKIQSSIQKHFETWTNFLEVNGIKPINTKTFWTKETALKSLYDFISLHHRLPTAIDFNIKTTFPKPCTKTIQNLFGSWNKFIIEAGYSPKTGYGIPTVAKDKVTYRSKLEADFVDRFLYQQEIYKYGEIYQSKKYFYDFTLVTKDIYIELAGLLDKEFYAQNLVNKVNENLILGRKLLVLTPNDVYYRIKNLQDYITYYDFTNRNFK